MVLNATLVEEATKFTFILVVCFVVLYDLLQPLISAVGYSKLFGLTALRVWIRECIGWVEWVIVGCSGIYRIGEKSGQHGPERGLVEIERVNSVCPRVEHTNFVHFAIYAEEWR